MIIKLNHPMRGYPANHKLTIQTDKAGVPLDGYWRRRLKDAVYDNCIEVVTKPAKPAKPAKPRKEHD